MIKEKNGWTTEGNISKCKNCGAEIVWYKSNSGKWSPLNCIDKKHNVGFAIGGDFHKCNEISKYAKQKQNVEQEVTYNILVKNSKGRLKVKKVTEMKASTMDLKIGHRLQIEGMECIIKEVVMEGILNVYLATTETESEYEEYYS